MVYFNFCRKISFSGCNNSPTLAALVNSHDGTCYPLASDSPKEGVSTRMDKARVYTSEERQHILGEDSTYGRLDLIYEGSSKCFFN